VRVAIVGCGLIGAKRARALGSDDRVVLVADTDRDRAAKLAGETGARIAADAAQAIGDPETEAVIVAVTHDQLAPIALAAIQAGKPVLLEKPGARQATELDPLIAAAQTAKVTVKVGYNHRFHPAFQKARQLVDSGVLGPLLFVRGRYGHGGRLGYETEWRFNPAVSGGGELLDQGSHLIDLAGWFLGDFATVDGHLARYFWNAPVEDNAFISLRTAQGQTAWLQAGWTEWKNIFSFEIMGRVGKLQIDGLGGSYGTETLTHYQMLPEMGPPKTERFEFAQPDSSWAAEWREFAEAVAARRPPAGGLDDARRTLAMIDRLYERTRGS